MASTPPRLRANIIGAGVSGLSLGIHLQRNGFATQIFEKHNLPGGLCTSWKRGEYTIDGCAQWILGSAGGSGFHKLWNELLDLRQIQFVNHDVRMHIELKGVQDRHGSNTFHYYTDLQKLEDYLVDLSPEDAPQLRKWLIQPVRVLQRFELPPVNDPLPIVPAALRMLAMTRYASLAHLFYRLRGETNLTLSQRLKSPFLREAMRMLYDGEEVELLSLHFPMACFDKRSAGYPIGGSLHFAERLAESYRELGGTIHYHTPVHAVIVVDGVAKGLRVRHEVEHFSDLIVSTADWHHTMFGLLEGQFVDRQMLALQAERDLEIYPSVVQCGFGIRRDLRHVPHFVRFPLDKELESPDGTKYPRMELHLYHYDPTMAPQGKTTGVVSFYTKQRDFWIDLRKRDRAAYRATKQRFLDQVTEQVDRRLGGIMDCLEMTDVATPATVQRYTNSWKGSSQGWWPSRKRSLARLGARPTVPGLRNFYYGSHWCQPGGGLPTVILVSRQLAKKICRHTGRPFRCQ